MNRSLFLAYEQARIETEYEGEVLDPPEETSEPTVTILARRTDLWADGEGGWSENGACVKQVEITVPVSWTDNQIVRRIKSELDIVGWRPDGWCGADWVWRNGCIGAYADIIR